jgi:multisubunit Na+/H+ antiporter MnhG subunit
MNDDNISDSNDNAMIIIGLIFLFLTLICLCLFAYYRWHSSPIPGTIGTVPMWVYILFLIGIIGLLWILLT